LCVKCQSNECICGASVSTIVTHDDLHSRNIALSSNKSDDRMHGVFEYRYDISGNGTCDIKSDQLHGKNKALNSVCHTFDSCIKCQSNECICGTSVSTSVTHEDLHSRNIALSSIKSDELVFEDFNIYTVLENNDLTAENDTFAADNINDLSHTSHQNNEHDIVHEDDCDTLITSLKESRLRNPKSLVFAHVNINSLKKEEKAPLDYFKDILDKGFLDILCVSEAKLNDSITEKDVDCGTKFKVYRKDRTSRSGGLVAWLRSDIPQQRVHDLEFDCSINHIESMVFELKIKKEIWYIIFAYKNPTAPNDLFLDKLKYVYEGLVSKAKEIILLGDINIDMLETGNDLSNKLCDVYDLENLISDPTCFKNPEGTLLDPILVRNAKRFRDPINVFCGYSDWHHMVGCITKLHIPPPKPLKITYRNLKEFDPDIFKEHVSQIPFQVCNIFEDVSDQYWAKCLLFTEVLNEHAPLKQRTIKEEHVPYMNSDLRKEMYSRNMHKNKHLSDRKNPIKWLLYRQQRNKVTGLRRKAIRDFFLSKGKPGASPRDFWNAIGPFLSNKKKSQRNIILKEHDHIVTDTPQLCEISANFFSTVADSIGIPDHIDMSESNFLSTIIEKHKNHDSIKAIKETHKDIEAFSFKPVQSDYVQTLLSKLNVQKATGYDNIPPKMVKICAKELSVTLTELINDAFKCNRFPSDMKKAEISPIFKKKDDMLKDNYRPISILSVFSKVFETVVADQLMEYYRTIFDDMLCAYRKKYGTEHVLIKLIDSWKKALDCNNFVGTVLMDLSKAFDCIPHGLLIAKMSAYGVSNNACEFMSSYLSDRYQRVKISNEKSLWTQLLKGIPQGSCLGPFLFNVFMNDIFYFIETCDLSNYADDNTLDIIGSTVETVLSALRKDTDNAIKWFVSNYMQVNPSKFQFMFLKPLSSKEVTPEFIEVNGTHITCEDKVNLLGITIDDKLKFDKHVVNLCKKAARQLNVMYRFKRIFDLKERERIYNTFILSNFNYCPTVWHFCGKVCTKKIEHIQERALRFMFNDKESSYSSLLSKCGYKTLHIRRIKVIASEVFKSLHDLNPTFMKKMFKVKDISYDLRASNILWQPKFNMITYGKNTFNYYGSHIWNLLPNDLKKCTSLDNFKSLLRTWDGPHCQCMMCDALN
jgi:exonuclease III